MIKKKWLFYTTVILFVSLCFFFMSHFFSTTKNNPNLKVAFFIESSELLNAYLLDENKADSIYTDKVIEVYGTVKNITYLNNRKTIILNSNNNNSSVICDITYDENNSLKEVKKNQKIVVIGVCKGFLKDVILLDCYIKN